MAGNARKSVKGPVNVVPLHVAAAGEKAVILPPDGWTPNAAHGLQRRDATPSGMLVRIEDVAAWLAQTYPRKEVIYKLFSELIPFHGADADYLYILNSQTFAKPLIDGWRVTEDTDGWWQFFPFIDSGAGLDIVARDIAEAWERVWPGLSNPGLDHDFLVQRTIARNIERNDRRKAWQEGTEHTYLDWPEDDYLLQLLGRLAIPVATAFSMWGYGRAVAPAAAVHSLMHGPTAALEPASNEWDGARLLARRDELKGQGVRNFNQKLQELSGLKEREILRLIEAAE